MTFKTFIKKTVAIALCFAFLLLAFTFSVSAAEVCPDIIGHNSGKHNYYYAWSEICNSFLIETADGGFMRFQSNVTENSYLVEYFTADFNLKSHKYIQEELPIFGGFHAGENYYFVVSGQENYEESPDVECFRITKYDRNWNRINSTGLYDCNTVEPFAFGMLRFAEYNKYLLIRTCHLMYTAADGLNHQANVTIQLDTENMVITDSAPYVANSGAGYASHSFNQFIHVENGRIIALDHGDAYPRSIVLTKSLSDISSGSFGRYCSNLDILKIPSAIGNNFTDAEVGGFEISDFTGVEVGGFEISDTSYLVAYNCVDFNAPELVMHYLKKYTGDIFVSAVDKSTNKITTHKFTDFPFGEEEYGDPGNPYLVKISDSNFALLWQEGDNVRYTFLNAFGEANSSIYTFKNAYLSDCQPIVSGGEVIWYTFDYNDIYFYNISVKSPEITSVTKVNDDHSFKVLQYPNTLGGDCTIKCEKCGLSETFNTGEDFSVYWRIGDNEDDYFSSWLETTDFMVGDSLWVTLEDDDFSIEHNEKIITVSNPDVLSISEEEGFWGDTYRFEFLKAGTVTITDYYKYNPAVIHSYTFNVDGESSGGGNNNDGENNGCAHTYSLISSATTPGGYCVGKCVACGYTKNFRTSSYIVDYWNTDKDIEGIYHSPITTTGFKVGDSVSATFEDGEEGIVFNEKIVTVSDESGVSMKYDNGFYNFEFLKTGRYTITVSYKYSPSVSKSVSVTVFGENDGDVNKNGAIDSMDYLYLKRAYFNQYPIPEIETVDLDKNGKLESMDYLYLKRAYFSAYSLG